MSRFINKTKFHPIFLLIQLIAFSFIFVSGVSAMGIIRGRVRNTVTNTYIPAPGQPTPDIQWCSENPQGGCITGFITPGAGGACCIHVGQTHIALPEVLESAICANWVERTGSGKTGTVKSYCEYSDGSSAWKTPPCPPPYYHIGGNACGLNRSQFPTYTANMWIVDDLVDMPIINMPGRPKSPQPPPPLLEKPYFKFEDGWACDNADTFFTGIANEAYPGTFTRVNFHVPNNDSDYHNLTDILYTPSSPNTSLTPVLSTTLSPPSSGPCTCEKVDVIGTLAAGETVTLTTYARSLEPDKSRVYKMIYHVERDGVEIKLSDPIEAIETAGEPGRYYTTWVYTIPAEGTGTLHYRIWVDIFCAKKEAQNISGETQVLGAASSQNGGFFANISRFFSSLLGISPVSPTPTSSLIAPTITIIRPTGVRSPQLGSFLPPATDVYKGCHEVTFTISK